MKVVARRYIGFLQDVRRDSAVPVVVMVFPGVY
jgi:hypothetical protein